MEDRDIKRLQEKLHRELYGRDPVEQFAYNVGIALRYAIKIALAVLVVWAMLKLLGVIK